MTHHNQPSYVPSCRPVNPGECAQCTLSYDCESKADSGPTIHWPVVGLAIGGVLMLLVQAF